MFNGSMSVFQTERTGSNPVRRSNFMKKNEQAIRRAVLREVKKKWDAAACTFDKWLNAQVKKPKKKF